MFLLKIVFACLTLFVFLTGDVSATDKFGLEAILEVKRQHANEQISNTETFNQINKVIWGVDVAKTDSQARESLKQKREPGVYDHICSLDAECMPIAFPHETAFSQTPDLYRNDNHVYITVFFGLMTDLWDNGFYDHSGIVFEQYDPGKDAISTSYYHLRTRDDWTRADITLHSGYSNRDYIVTNEPWSMLVERMICHPKYKSNLAHYEPYKTFKLPKSEQTKLALAWLDELCANPRHSYSLYGKKPALLGGVKGRHNCVSFVAEVLWQFGIFEPQYDLRHILSYKEAYPVEASMPYAPVDWIVRALMLSPETVKHLVDNERMINPEHVFKLHQAAKLPTRRSERQGTSYVIVSDDLKWNIVNTVLSSQNYVLPINIKAAENEEHPGQSSGAIRAHIRISRKRSPCTMA